MEKRQPEQLTKPTRFLLKEANFFRDGVVYPKGSIYTMPAGERPSVTWVEVDEAGVPVKAGPKASDAPVHPAKQLPETVAPAKEVEHGKHDKHHGKRTSDTTPL